MAELVTWKRDVQMANKKRAVAARQNIKQAQKAAIAKRLIANSPISTRRCLSEQVARTRSRGCRATDRTRVRLCELAKSKELEGRSTTGTSPMVDALRRR
jgi:hypothetical protein